MGIHIDVRIALTPAQKKIIRAAVVTGSVIAALGIGLAIAAPHQWKSNDPLAAADLNGLNVVTYTSDAGTAAYSVGATTYCGSTPFSTQGNIAYAGLKGYAAAKKACETGTSCGNSATAHMCTPEELVRSSQLGVATGDGWVSSGVVWVNAGSVTSDCLGWSTTNATSWGPSWVGTAIAPVGNADSCTSSHPILCCD